MRAMTMMIFRKNLRGFIRDLLTIKISQPVRARKHPRPSVTKRKKYETRRDLQKKNSPKKQEEFSFLGFAFMTPHQRFVSIKMLGRT